MQTGISIYPGLDNSPEENLALIETAAKNGIQRLFTSFHIPETDTAAFKEEIGQLLHAARKAGMEIISDVSPNTLALLGMEKFSLSAFLCGKNHCRVKVLSGLCRSALFKTCLSIPEQAFCDLLRHLFAQGIHETVILPQRKSALPVAAEKTFLLFHHIISAGRTFSYWFIYRMHQHFCVFYNFIGPDQFTEHVLDFRHEFVCIKVFLFHFDKLLFPFCCH